MSVLLLLLLPPMPMNTWSQVLRWAPLPGDTRGVQRDSTPTPAPALGPGDPWGVRRPPVGRAASRGDRNSVRRFWHKKVGAGQRFLPSATKGLTPALGWQASCTPRGPRAGAGRFPRGDQGPSAAFGRGVPEDPRLGPSPELRDAGNPRPGALLAKSPRRGETTAISKGTADSPAPHGAGALHSASPSPSHVITPASPPRQSRQSTPPLFRPASCGPISTALGGAGRDRGRRRGRAPLMPAGG